MPDDGILEVPQVRNIDIEFDNVFYSVKDGRKGKKDVIKGVSGTFKSGELTAIMGPSGAGKTSLLNILTGFQTSGVTGTIKCSNPSNNKKGASQYKKESCYILQDDHLAPYFTVEEVMQIATKLKINSNTSEKAKTFLINEVLESLSLLHCKKTRCNKLSGGQKKRLSIALELIDNPPIMFLDEPTTGLDSSSSTQCIQMLKALARGGRTIVCTIHQPSASLYEVFDHVYVMAAGHCVYQGASLNTVPYLASVGFNCPKYHNPADFLLEVANGDYGECTEVLAKTVDRGKWRTPSKEIKSDIPIEEEVAIKLSQDHASNLLSNVAPPSEFSKFRTLLSRTFLHLYRDWTISHLRLALHLMVGILLGLMFLNFGQDASKTYNNVGFFLISVVYLNYTSLMPAVLKFPSELSVLKKERFNNWYKLKTYFAAFLLADIPMQILFSMTYTSVAYYLSSQPMEIERYSMVQVILTLVALCASGMGLALGTIFNPINGTFLGAILTALMLSVSGFLIFFNHLPKLLYALTYVSYMSFAMEGLVQATYGNNRSALICPDDVEYCHYKFPISLRREMGMEVDNFWTDITYLIVTCILLRIVSFYNLRRKLSSV